MFGADQRLRITEVRQADPAIDITRDIAAFFARSLDIAAKAGIP